MSHETFEQEFRLTLFGFLPIKYSKRLQKLVNEVHSDVYETDAVSLIPLTSLQPSDVFYVFLVILLVSGFHFYSGNIVSKRICWVERQFQTYIRLSVDDWDML